MGGAAPRPAFARLMERAHFDLFTNVAALALSTAGGAAIGFIFWWLAARCYSAQQLGVASASISAMNLLGLLGDLGLGTFSISAIHRTDRVAALISTCLVSAALCSGALGLAFLLVAPFVSLDLAQFTDGFVRSFLFIAGVAITGVVLVFDQALVGILRSSLQLTRNLLASVLKLLILGVAVFLAWGDALAIFIAWVIGSVGSLMFVLVLCMRQKSPVIATVDWRLLRGMGPSILGHHALNLSTQAVGLLLPLVVTAMISAQANAAFFAAWMIVQVWCLGPAALATVLFPIAVKEPGRLAHLMRLTLLLSLAIGLLGEVVLIVLGRGVLSLFNPDFVAEGYGALVVLGAAIVPLAVKYHFVALRRIQNRTASTSILLGVAAALEISCAMIGAYVGGVFGLCLGWLLAATLQAVAIFPSLIGAMRGVTDFSSDGVKA